MNQIIISPVGEDGKIGPQTLKKVSPWNTFIDRAFFLGGGLGIGFLMGLFL